MKSNGSKFLKFLAGLAVSSLIFSNANVFCMEKNPFVMTQSMVHLLWTN